jgi:hypothetical protein
MADIKVKEVGKKTIKTLDKGVIATERLKDTIVHTKEKAESTQSNDSNIIEDGSNKITFVANRTVDETVYHFNKYGKKAVVDTKDNVIKTKVKIKNIKDKLLAQKNKKVATKGTKTAIKTGKSVAKKTEKVAKESVKASQRALKLARETAKQTARATKAVVKATISAIKGIIAATKALISLLLAGGWVAMVVIVIICLIGLLVGSIFGIFFSSEKTRPNAITMKDVIAECNQEFSDKLQTIQDQNPHDDYVLDGNMATWKDVLIIYTVKQANGFDGGEVITMDDNKKALVKQIFWEMNSLSSEVKTEKVTEQGVNTDEMPKEVEKRVLHIKITSKNAEQMKNDYHFNSAQIRQYNELSSSEYNSLWGGVIYGLNNIGDFINWRQAGQSWSNIRIGNTNSTIGNIGCLVTSIAILIEKSGANTTIVPFNPGTFVEALNSNGGFDEKGNLYYAPINKVVPNFRYVGNVNLRGKTRAEKLELIKQYLNLGFHITIEVKGATPGNQHWVAILGVDGNNVNIVDPASDKTDLWSAYEWSKSSQFNYFKAE